MVNPSTRVIKAASTGYISLEALNPGDNAKVMGISSQGIFLKPAGTWLIFVSFGSFRGPLTITLNQIDESLALVNPGNPVRVHSDGLLFPLLDLNIFTAGCEAWHAPIRPAPLRSGTKRLESVAHIARKALTRDEGISPYLFTLFKLLDAKQQITPMSEPDETGFIHIQKDLIDWDLPNLTSLLNRFIGVGEGLTPGGDDFLIGLLLCLNRWGDVLWPGKNLSTLNQSVVQSAYEGTTTLSANLIDCAARGQADERLINGLDWIMTSASSEDEVVQNLLTWGHSSGVNAFTGMAVAITA